MKEYPKQEDARVGVGAGSRLWRAWAHMTVDVADHLAASGTGRLDVVCPGFPADCLETLEEIKVQLRDRFLAAGGGDFHYIPALNDSPHWISAMADMVEPLLQEKQND